jgi:hypothetical protein
VFPERAEAPAMADVVHLPVPALAEAAAAA